MEDNKEKKDENAKANDEQKQPQDDKKDEKEVEQVNYSHFIKTKNNKEWADDH